MDIDELEEFLKKIREDIDIAIREIEKLKREMKILENLVMEYED